jgi:hypothetical protein
VAFTTGVHCAICALMNARYSSGVLAATSMARPASFSCTSGRLSIAVVSACSFAVIAFGVFAGACRPWKLSAL